MQKKWLLLMLVVNFLLLQSCTKLVDQLTGKDIITLCDSVRSARIIAPKTTYVMGENIDIYNTCNIQNIFFNWSLTNIYGETTNNFNLNYCNKTNEGWYYMTASNPQCNKPKTDSVYIKVICPQVAAPCAVTDNTIDFSGLGIAEYTSAVRRINMSNAMLELYASDYFNGNPQIDIYFHSYWSNIEPEDGLYTTNDVLSMSDKKNIYKVYISFISGAYFTAHPDQKVYISHVNGKLKATLCDVKASGEYWGSIINTTLTGSLIGQ